MCQPRQVDEYFVRLLDDDGEHALAVRATQDRSDGGDEGVEVAAIRERLGGAANCSAFISKLWYLMINPDMYSQYIRWSEAGDAIVISNDPDLSNEFAADVLPKLFKHGNNASFVRQLNVSASCLSREKLRC